MEIVSEVQQWEGIVNFATYGRVTGDRLGGLQAGMRQKIQEDPVD